MVWKKYKHQGTHLKLKIKGEKFHLIDDESFNGVMLENYYQGDTDARKRLEEKLKIAKEALEFYAKPLCEFSPLYNVAEHHKKAVEALKEIKE